MPVIGHATDNGHLSFIYELGQNDFLRTIADAVHAAHPFHLVGGFERFGHIFLPCHSTWTTASATAHVHILGVTVLYTYRLRCGRENAAYPGFLLFSTECRHPQSGRNPYGY